MLSLPTTLLLTLSLLTLPITSAPLSLPLPRDLNIPGIRSVSTIQPILSRAQTAQAALDIPNPLNHLLAPREQSETPQAALDISHSSLSETSDALTTREASSSTNDTPAETPVARAQSALAALAIKLVRSIVVAAAPRGVQVQRKEGGQAALGVVNV